MVTPSFRGGSWRRIDEVVERLRDRQPDEPRRRPHLAVGYSSLRRSAPPEPIEAATWDRTYRVPFGDYSRWHVLVRAPWLAVLVSLPLAVISHLVVVRHRPQTLLANELVLAFLHLPIARLLRIRLVVAHHGWVGEVGGAAAWLTRRLGRRLARVFVNSRGSADDLARLLDRSQLTIIEHNAPAVFFDQPRPLETIEGLAVAGRPLLLFVSRLDPEKNVDLLLETVDRLMKSSDESPTAPVLVVCGDGGLAPRIAELVERWPDRVRWLGYVEDQAHLARLYATATVFWGCAAPTYLELPAVEALAAGTPLLIPRRPSILGLRRTGEAPPIDPHLVPAAIGRLVDPAPDALAAALGEMLQPDAFDRQAIRALARERYGLANLDPMLEALDPRSD